MLTAPVIAVNNTMLTIMTDLYCEAAAALAGKERSGAALTGGLLVLERRVAALLSLAVLLLAPPLLATLLLVDLDHQRPVVVLVIPSPRRRPFLVVA